MQLFTVDQANATLPLVRRIVEDVVREHRRRGEKLVELDLRTSAMRDDVPDQGLVLLEREIAAIGRELESFERELRSLGVQLKDPRIGLVDFPSNLEGRRVLLCWHLGEPSVRFWHDESSGFAGRQPLSPTLVG
jgi:hypothetical protein